MKNYENFFNLYFIIIVKNVYNFNFLNVLILILFYCFPTLISEFISFLISFLYLKRIVFYNDSLKSIEFPVFITGANVRIFLLLNLMLYNLFFIIFVLFFIQLNLIDIKLFFKIALILNFVVVAAFILTYTLKINSKLKFFKSLIYFFSYSILLIGLNFPIQSLFVLFIISTFVFFTTNKTLKYEDIIK